MDESMGIAPAETNMSTLYRETTLGRTLMESLREMIQQGKFGPDLSSLVMQQFDQSFIAGMHNVGQRATIKGHIHTYRYIDGVWTWVLEDAIFKSGHESIPLDFIKIVACDPKSK
eukprot:TRINITY_DN6497_c0_g1_i2.p1 TRINITY_DN6497_c0_g1~~TRINITY_DN6497_c0_g1_i2.p1  ORF type:complete len:115 (+),score=12.79 TRINITY_DN6497_c0_g1_i2:72-416(+)